MTWFCIAVKKPSVSANKCAFVSHMFDVSVSTYCWLRSYGWRPCKAFWDHCLLTLLLYSSSSLLLLLITPWSTVLLENLTGSQLVKNSPHFMEPEISLPHSQVPATCINPEPARPSPCSHIQLPEHTS